MPNKKKPELLPGIKYAPRGDAGGRGGGDYEYYNRANSYAANPDYAQQFGGGGGAPPTLPPLNSPPQDPPPQPRSFGEDAGDAYRAFTDFINNSIAGYNETEKNIGNALGPIGDYFFGNGEKTADPEGWEQKVGRPVNTAVGQTPQGWSPNVPSGTGAGAGVLNYDPLQKAWQGMQDLWGNFIGGLGQGGGDPTGRTPPGWSPGAQGTDPVGKTPPGWSPGVPSGAQGTDGRTMNEATGKTPPGWVPTVPNGAPGADQAARLQDAVNKNQNLTQQAKDTGNDKELARLQAEWDRIAPKAAKYGITADRLINSYMQPGNPAAETSLDRAMGRAIADDTWAQAAGVAFGRPPNQLEWDEHWRAMNQGGRDPLEGHPAAIQAIQAKMQEIESENQNEAYGQYQQWLANQ
jgi:hypothetical protein